VSKWDRESLLYSVTQHQIGNYTVQRGPRNATSHEASVETTEQSCEAMSVLYAVEVTFPHGIRTMQHSLSDIRSLPKQKDIFDDVTGMPGIGLVLPPEPQALEDWHRKILAAIPISNEWALLDALGSVLEGIFYEYSSPRLLDHCLKENRTDMQECWNEGRVNGSDPANYSGEVPIPIYRVIVGTN
jgi:hypothetical protein